MIWPLDKVTTRNGLLHVELLRRGNRCLYEVYSAPGVTAYFIIFIVKVHIGVEHGGSPIYSEVFPKPDDYLHTLGKGYAAYRTPAFKQALILFTQLPD